MSTTQEHISIHFFKKGLRIHDNAALLHAVTTSKIVYPVFVWDEDFWGRTNNIGIKRRKFLFRCLKDLQKNLKLLGSNLFVLKGDTVSVLETKVKEWNITQLTFMLDTEDYYRDRDQLLVKRMERLDVSVVSKVGHTLYDINSIWKANKGTPPLTYRTFLSIIAKLKEPPLVVRTIHSADFESCETPTSADHDLKNEWLTPDHCDDDDDNCKVWPGGETVALQRLQAQCDFFHNDENQKPPPAAPGLLFPSTTGLSPYFCFGCLSPRLFYHSMKNKRTEARKHRLTPVSLQGQVLWRDFFYTVSMHTPNFTRMKGNPICLQICWQDNQEYLARWSEGRTGFPWIDAIMRQLRAEGWIHHLARHAVACFLTRGDLWLSWEEGQKVFDNHLIDADYSMNAGNWMWLSASAFCHRYDKTFHPVHFGRRLDPTGQFVRRYVKEVAEFPTKYIYDPWKAPLDVQEKAHCIIGKDYPTPVVNHADVSATNRERMREFRMSQSSTIELTADSFDYDAQGKGSCEMYHRWQELPADAADGDDDAVTETTRPPPLV